MQKRGFYVDINGGQVKEVYKKLTLRNRYIKWNLRYAGIPVDIPDGFWVVTLVKDRTLKLPGLMFREA